MEWERVGKVAEATYHRSMIDPSFVRDVESLVREHAPEWTVSVGEYESAHGLRARVEIVHPLSDGFVISRSPLDPLTLEKVERWLFEGAVAWHAEFLSKAPKPKNPETVRSVLRYAEMFAWTNLEVKAVASVLVDAEVVSDEEYDWLRNTIGRNAPDLSRPNPQPQVYREYRYRIGE